MVGSTVASSCCSVSPHEPCWDFFAVQYLLTSAVLNAQIETTCIQGWMLPLIYRMILFISPLTIITYVLKSSPLGAAESSTAL